MTFMGLMMMTILMMVMMLMMIMILMKMMMMMISITCMYVSGHSSGLGHSSSTVSQHSFDLASEKKPLPPHAVDWQRCYACMSTHIHHAIFTLESPKSNCFDLCVRKHMWQATSKLTMISKQVKRKGKSKLKASYKQAKSKLKAS